MGNLGCGMATSVVSNQSAPPYSLIRTAVRARLVHFQWGAYYLGGGESRGLRGGGLEFNCSMRVCECISS